MMVYLLQEAIDIDNNFVLAKNLLAWKYDGSNFKKGLSMLEENLQEAKQIKDKSL